MLFIAKYDASYYFLINSDYMPFKCGVDMCFNKSHIRANLHDGTVNYYSSTDIKTFEIKEIYRNDGVYKI